MSIHPHVQLIDGNEIDVNQSVAESQSNRRRFIGAMCVSTLVASITLLWLLFATQQLFAQAAEGTSDAQVQSSHVAPDDLLPESTPAVDVMDILAPSGVVINQNINACTINPVATWSFTGYVTTPEFGQGELLVGTGLSETGVVTPGNPAGSGDPALRAKGWPTGTLDIAANDYFEFKVNTTNFINLRLAFAEQRSGNNGPLEFAVFYSADGSTYTQLFALPITDDSRWRIHTLDFSSITSLNNNPNARFRIYGYQTELAGGRWSVDDVKVTSVVCDDTPTAVPPTPTPVTPTTVPPTPVSPTPTPIISPPTPTPATPSPTPTQPVPGETGLTIVLDSIPDDKPPEDPDDHKFSGSLGTFTLEDPQYEEHNNKKTFHPNSGTYTIRKVSPDRYFVTAINCTPSNLASVDLTNSSVTVRYTANSNVTCVFVSEKEARIRTVVYHDKNKNNKWDDGDSTLRNWKITITNQETNQKISKSTSDEGKANFSTLRPGHYQACETLKNGWTNSQPSNSLCYSFTVQPGKTASLRFGNYKLSQSGSDDDDDDDDNDDNDDDDDNDDNHNGNNNNTSNNNSENLDSGLGNEVVLYTTPVTKDEDDKDAGTLILEFYATYLPIVQRKR